MKSSSHLTRAVFRALIDNKPFVVAECRRRPQHVFSRSRKPFLPYTPTRTRMFGAMFGAMNSDGFDGAKNTPKNLELALGKLVDLVRARRARSRGPPDEEVISAFRFLFGSRLESERRLTRNEVYLATEVFTHLQERGLVMGTDPKSALTEKDLDTVLETLALPSGKEKFRSDTRALAASVFTTLSRTTAESSSKQTDSKIASLPSYATVLARTGSSGEALALLRDSNNSSLRNNIPVWIEILKGLVSEGRTNDFEMLSKELYNQSKQLDAIEYEQLISFLAMNDNFIEARRVYEHQIECRVLPTTLQLERLLELCARMNQLDYGKHIAQTLESRIEEDGVEALLAWAAVQHSDPVTLKQELNRLVGIAQSGTLTTDSFNRVVEAGYSKNKPEVAAVASEVAQSIGLQPNGKFFTLQLQYALQRRDLTAAENIYEELIRQDIPADDSDIPIFNRYITALAFSPDVDYRLLLRVIDNILERNADFDAEALAGVCRVFLQRDELEDLTSVLRQRVDFFPSADRARVSSVFQEFILDPSVKEQRAFNVYELFRTAFPETPVENRLPIMQSFFDRKRPDMACLVFGHMRQREDIEARPSPEAYAQCFAGIGQCRDVDGLQMVYNMLKLDLEVEPTTRIRNGLMLANIACQMPYTAMIDHFWKIMDSREGPSYSTFLVALRACETWVPQGGYEARKIMALVQAWNLEVTKEMYDCYVGALAGQSEFENTIELIEEMENEIGEQPDVFTIGTFYNAIPWQYRKDEVEKWAKKAYPDLWEELESFGDEIDEEWEVRYFKIDRSIDIDDPPLFGQGKYDPQISRNAVQGLEPPSEKV